MRPTIDTEAPRSSPGTSVTPPERDEAVARSGRPIKEFGRRLLRSRRNLLCLGYLGAVCLVAAFAGPLAPASPSAQDLSTQFAPLLGEHLLGTDHFGRDVLSRMIYATRISLIAPVLAVGVGTAIGLPLGLLAGYLGGRLDWVLGRFADALIALPSLVLAVAIIGVLGPSLVNAMLAVGIAYAPRLFRVVRGAALAVREETYIEASRVVGCSIPRTIFGHVLPNIASPLLVQLSLMMGLALIAEAALSFLGLGVQPPDASWGVMLREASEDKFEAPWLILPPGIAIMLTVLAFNLLGDGVRDAVGRENRVVRR